mmetsp:Transcript_23111/g.72680  ORF Transcript_23111/g.72680 Transcript_23111/m.72680 type:complete len:263 (+) Transcript_23111:758-1546(+)
MPKRLWESGLLCALMQRSAQRSVLSVASRIRSVSLEVEEMTSSSAMMMSAPMAFCDSMDFSGVSSMRLPSFLGSSNSTPSSLITASLSSETIWKPPLSVKMLPDHCIRLCSPPHFFSRSHVGRLAKWKVLPSKILHPKAFMSSEDMPLMVPCVPTGMKTGVNTSPWGRLTVVARALPQFASNVKTRGCWPEVFGTAAPSEAPTAAAASAADAASGLCAAEASSSSGAISSALRLTPATVAAIGVRGQARGGQGCSQNPVHWV